MKIISRLPFYSLLRSSVLRFFFIFFFFFFTDTATTEIYTLSLHDALPISSAVAGTERELRLDLFRGLALWLIFIDHLPPNILTWFTRSEEHTSELQSLRHLVCRLLLEKKKKTKKQKIRIQKHRNK